MYEYIKKDRIKNKDIRNKCGVASIVDKMRKERLKKRLTMMDMKKIELTRKTVRRNNWIKHDSPTIYLLYDP